MMEEVKEEEHKGSGWNKGRTSDIFRPFVALVRAELDAFGQTVRATAIRLCLRLDADEDWSEYDEDWSEHEVQ